MSETKFTEASALFSDKKYFDAVRVYASVAAADGASDEDRARALGNISACYALAKDFDKALESGEGALELQPANAKFMGRVATAYEGLRHYEEAAEFFERALRSEPASAVYADGLARVQALVQSRRGVASAGTRDGYYYGKSLQKGKEAMAAANYLEAARHFQKAIDLFPAERTGGVEGRRELAILHANRSAASFRAGAIEESADDALVATEIDPTYARGFFRLGCAKHRLRKHGDSHDALAACLRLEPGHAEAAALLAEVEPMAAQERMTAPQRAAQEAGKVAEVRERQAEERAEASARAAPAGRHAHASSYVYCSYCNESGHTRAECPMRRKRPRY